MGGHCLHGQKQCTVCSLYGKVQGRICQKDFFLGLLLLRCLRGRVSLQVCLALVYDSFNLTIGVGDGTHNPGAGELQPVFQSQLIFFTFPLQPLYGLLSSCMVFVLAQLYPGAPPGHLLFHLLVLAG